MSIIPILQGKKATQLPVISTLTGNEVLYVVSDVGVSSQTKSSAIIDLLASVGSGALLASNNLSDIPNKVLARANLGLGTLAIQNANSAVITGGNIDGTPIGNSNPSTGKFTNLEVTDTFIIPPGSISLSSIAGQIPNSKLENSSFSVNLSNGLGGSSTVALGASLDLTINEVDGGLF